METLVYTTRVSSEKKKSFREKCEHFRFLQNFASICFAKNAKFPQNRKLENFAKKKCENFANKSENIAKISRKNGNYAKNTKI